MTTTPKTSTATTGACGVASAPATKKPAMSDEARAAMQAKFLALFATAEGEIQDAYLWALDNSFEYNEAFTGMLLSLDSKHIIALTQFTKQFWDITPEGAEVLENGSPEWLLFNAVPSDGISKEMLEKNKHYRAGFPEAMKLKWIKMDGPNVKSCVTSPVDLTKKSLAEIKQGRAPDKTEEVVLKAKKKFIKQVSISSYKIKKGESFSTTVETLESDLTIEALKSGSWKTQAIKPHNLHALGVIPPSGYIHPLNKVRKEIRQIFLEMGFQEMPTNNYVESSFWNFDSLFQPQQHPARDLHDTFFLSDPAAANENDCAADYLERVKQMHEKGGSGSIGWRYDWKLSEARKIILRTHTTAVSSRMLYQLSQRMKAANEALVAKGNPPTKFQAIKCFSMDRVFRNETLDATHLAEFHQIEGFIADYDIGLPHLIGTLSTFFRKLGMSNLRFKPAFNPYTEPSMEIFCYHPQLKREIEIGNSGVFRPELLVPMGIPSDVNVIAWGLSLERPTMIKYAIPTIRNLFGPLASLEYIRKAPICIITPAAEPAPQPPQTTTTTPQTATTTPTPHQNSS
ncbi:phenylalanine--tRNA ligase alpha subunit [Pelomyxa schiedti]|nr:phenylalanine--tRNA ligase alpha subunit [Pelomyxa schiedti]